jgi:hypothetical protein
LYYVGSVFVVVVGVAVMLLCAMVYAERGGDTPVVASIGHGVRSFGDQTYDLFRSVYETGRQDDAHTHSNLIAPVDFRLDEALAPASAPGIALAGVHLRHGPAARPGWRIVVGMFDLDGERRHAAIAFDADMTVRHVWPLHEQGLELPEDVEVAKPFYKFPHGFAPLPDGSIVFGFDHGKSLRRFDVCGRELWSRIGGYHHAVTYDADTDSIWVLRAGAAGKPGAPVDETFQEWILQLAAEDGRELRAFHLNGIMAANPDLDILGIRQVDDPEGTKPKWAHDPFHMNDVDPLPAALVDRFPGFEAEDVLLSLRSLNLVFAVDPDTLDVRWYRVGTGRRQHDPDWLPDGRLMVFDNNMNRGPSRILAVDPATYDVEVVVDGAVHDFYSSIRGKHQRLADGTVVITSAMQGRVLEVAPDGSVAFELVNFRDEATKEEIVVVSEALWLPPDWFEFDAFPECEAVVAER